MLAQGFFVPGLSLRGVAARLCKGSFFLGDVTAALNRRGRYLTLA